jgi:hypothetical protein
VGASPPDSCSGKAKNEAKNGGGRKREPKEEADFSPWKSAKKIEEEQNHFCQIKCVEEHFRWSV